MLTNKMLIFALALNTLFIFQQVTSAASVYDFNNYDLNKYPIVYRRFIRRRPPMYLNDEYSEEIVEIFHTNEKPPAYGPHMSDADVDKFIFCDFNRHLDECKKYWESRKPYKPTLTSIKSSTASGKTEPTTTTSTTTTTKATTTTTEPTTEFSKIPQLEEMDYNYNYDVEIINEVQIKRDQELDSEECEYYDYYTDL
ncbi:uncharacterized protein ACRADG_007352 [Cochliomyia hominivorax]